jgi:hypothetical protein
MDLQLYFRVLWRFRLLVLLGLILAVLLAFLSLASVSFGKGSPKVSYRKQLEYTGTAQIFVTQRGYPWGRTIYPVIPGPNGTFTTNYADSTRFAQLAILYAQLGTSDTVRRAMLRQGPIHGTISTAAGFDQNSRTSLPFFYVNATAPTGAQAVALANRTATTIRSVIYRQQAQADIPDKQRVVLQVFSAARNATVVSGRKKTLPIVIFLSVLLATIGLAFVLENLRPRLREVEAVPERDQQVDTPVAASSRLTR